MNKKTKAYEESDFVDVYDEAGTKLDPVPKQWVGTDLLQPGVTDKAPEGADQVKLPDGKPDDSWTVPQLKKFAADADPVIDLGDAKKKDDILKIVAPPAE